MQFLADFTGNKGLVEAPFLLRDMARMEGLRMQRDEAYRRFVRAEDEIFKRLTKPWDGVQDD